MGGGERKEGKLQLGCKINKKNILKINTVIYL